jgi:hypothetical protein
MFLDRTDQLWNTDRLGDKWMSLNVQTAFCLRSGHSCSHEDDRGVLRMKTNKSAAIAVALWLLFVASHVFAVCKPPYPLKSSPPDQIFVIAGADEERGVGIANKPK